MSCTLATLLGVPKKNFVRGGGGGGGGDPDGHLLAEGGLLTHVTGFVYVVFAGFGEPCRIHTYSSVSN